MSWKSLSVKSIAALQWLESVAPAFVEPRIVTLEMAKRLSSNDIRWFDVLPASGASLTLQILFVCL
jgi:hypothetical protein